MDGKSQQAQGGGARQRILRIGIILGGNIVEERLIRTREEISIGQSSKNTFSVPVEGLPKQWPLFALENNRYALQFREGMDGRVSDGQGVRTLDALKQSGATRHGDRWVLPLSEHSRGKIVAGDMTLLFQFVAAPPLQPRPRLPASVRGSLADRIEPQLAIILAISILAHFALAIYAFTHDQVLQSRTDRLHRQFVEDQYQERVITKTFDVPTTSETPTEQPGTEEKPEVPEIKKPAGQDRPDKPDKTESGDNKDEGAPDEAAIEEAIASTAFVKIATGEGTEGGRYGEMNYTDQGADLNKSIDNVKRGGGQVAAVGRPGDRGTRGPASGKIGGERGDGKVGGPVAGTGPGEKEEEQVKSLAKYDVLDVGTDTTLDPSAVASRIRSRYLDGIKRCHARALKADPKAGGKVSIRFTVGASGRVTRATVKGFDGSVNSCIQSLTRGWIFGIPKDDSGKPTDADFEVPLILKPGA